MPERIAIVGLGLIGKLHELLSEPRIIDALLDKPAEVGELLAVHQDDQVLEVQLSHICGANRCEQVQVRRRLTAGAGHNSAQVYVASAVSQNA